MPIEIDANAKITAAWYKASPNVGGPLANPTLIVMHYTASGAGAADYLCRPDAQASAHVVIERDGTIRQIVPFDRVAWHAGASSWKGRSGCNAFSIGIEITNWGNCTRHADGQWYSWANRVVPADQVIEAAHKNGGVVQGWQTYSEAQLAAVEDLTRALLARYPGITDIAGHDDVAPRNKVDPGPAFPMERFTALLGDRRPTPGGDVPVPVPTPAPAPTPAPDQRTWTLAMIEAARPTAAQIGVSAEAIVAQAALESGWGKAAIGHNLFGIKASHGWTGKTQTVRTREVDAGGQEYFIDAAFRDYDSFAASIADHFAFLDRDHYRNAGVFDRKGDAAYFEALQRAGYATDPNYAATLKSVLRSVQSIAGRGGPVTVPRTLRAGDAGDDVLALKRALNQQNGAMLDAGDNTFDGVTFLAVKYFQEARRLTVDGIVGPQTRKALGLM